MAGRGIRRIAAIVGALAVAATLVGCTGPVRARPSTAPAAAAVDPCALLTDAEVTGVLGAAASAQPRPSYDSTATCEWVPVSTPGGASALRLTVIPRGGAALVVPGDELAIGDGAVQYPDRGEIRVLVGSSLLSIDGGTAGTALPPDALRALAEHAAAHPAGGGALPPT